MSAKAVPAAIPTAMAGRKPWMNSCRLTATLLPSSPEAVIAISVSTTSEGVEIRSERMISSPPTICQTIRNSATAMVPIDGAGRGVARERCPGHATADRCLRSHAHVR